MKETKDRKYQRKSKNIRDTNSDGRYLNNRRSWKKDQRKCKGENIYLKCKFPGPEA